MRPGIVILARIAMSITGIIYIRAYAQILPFVWSPHSPEMQWAARWVCRGLIAILTIRAFGFGSWLFDRMLSIAHFAGAAWLFAHPFPCMTANEELYLILAFWTCFFQLNPSWSAR